MSDSPNKLSQLWQELKRRKVLRVITVYAAASFVILELVDIISDPLKLPEWFLTATIVFLCMGFIITVIVSWIYDIHPEGGIVKTEPAHEVKQEETLKSSQSWKVASYISFVVILVMVSILIYPKIFKADQFSDLRDEEGMISVAVLPFNNLTGDSSLYYWQNGISELLINGLAQSDELLVSSSHVVQDVLTGTKQVYSASLSPEIARRTASKISASTHITGNYIGSGNNVSIVLNLVNTENRELIWTTRVDGDLGPNYLLVIDRLSDTVRNYLEIKALEDKVKTDLSNAFPNSADAYRHYIDGLNAIADDNYEAAIESLEMAYEIDTTFTFAAFYLAFAYNFDGVFNEISLNWTRRAHELKNNLPPAYRPWIEMWYACFISKNIEDVRRNCNLMFEAAVHSRFLWLDLAVTCTNFLDDYMKALQAFEKLEALNQQWEDDWRYDRYYNEFAWTLLMADRPEEVDRVTDIGLRLNPENGWLVLSKGAADIMLGDSVGVQKHKDEQRNIAKKYGMGEATTEHYIGVMHCWAKDTLGAINYFRSAYELDSERLVSLQWLIECQLKCNINFKECLRLSEYGLTKQPESTGFQWKKAMSLHKLGKHQEALTILIELQEDWPGYQKNLRKDIHEVERALAKL